MLIFLKLSMLATGPVIASLALYLLEKKTKFGALDKKFRQPIIGVVFGIFAILATLFGVDVGGATANVRDASVLSAGLIFGAPAGIIAGVIGGAYRLLFAAGDYTRLACSLSTLFAGIIGAVLRKYMFDDKKPSWQYALEIGLVTEVLHMLMIFITNMSDIHTAFTFVEKCALPMITVNGVSVMLSVLLVELVGKERVRGRLKERQISAEFQKWLLVCVVFAFVVTGVFTLVLQNNIFKTDTDNLLSQGISDVKTDIIQASDENLLTITHGIADVYTQGADLTALAESAGVSEIDVIDGNGVIIASTNPAFVDYKMASGEQSAEFLVLLGDQSEYVQSYQPMSFFNNEVWRKYAGVKLESGGFIQAGYDAEKFQQDIGAKIIVTTRNRHIGKTGFIVIIDESRTVVASSHASGESLPEITDLPDDISAGVRFSAKANGEAAYFMVGLTEGFYIMAVLPRSEAVFSLSISVYITVFMEIVVFIGLFVEIYFLIKKLVIDNIRKVNQSLSKITGGNLNERVDVRTNEEFASLSDDINSTVLVLKNYIAEAAARIDKELEFAKTIQHSALPSVFPPYPNRTDFDIYALMKTAKEVGGDFYDFYMTGPDELAFLIADVSGKGIPAAMFMMRAKTLVKSYAETGMSVDEVFTKANDKLCESNDAEMFVTAWLGKLNLKSGDVEFANAGHNPPLIIGDGEPKYLKSAAGFVLAGMEGIKYRANSFKLNRGEGILLYTDGVTESTDAMGGLYGEERLMNAVKLAKESGACAKALCDAVISDAERFTGEAQQFDDITMLCVKLN